MYTSCTQSLRKRPFPAGVPFPGPIRAHGTAFTLGGLELLVHFTKAALTLPASLISLADAVVFARAEPGNVEEDLHSLHHYWAGLAIGGTELLNRLRTEARNRPVIGERGVFLIHERECGTWC